MKFEMKNHITKNLYLIFFDWEQSRMQYNFIGHWICGISWKSNGLDCGGRGLLEVDHLLHFQCIEGDSSVSLTGV